MPRRTLTAVALLLLASLAAAPASARTLKVCIGDEDFAPFSFLKREAPGQYLVRAAVERQGDSVAWTVAPWRRCIEGLRTAQSFDAVIGVAPNESFVGSMSFPMQAGRIDAHKALGGAAFMVARAVGNTADWDGEKFSRVSQPVHYPSGIVVVRERLAALGVGSTDSVKTPLQMMHMLRLGRIELAVVRQAEFEPLVGTPEFRGKVELLPRPLIAWDGHLALRRSLCEAEPGYCQALWAEIGRQRAAPGWAGKQQSLLAP